MKRSILVSLLALGLGGCAEVSGTPATATSTTASSGLAYEPMALAAARAAQRGRAEAGFEGSLGPGLLPAGRRHAGSGTRARFATPRTATRSSPRLRTRRTASSSSRRRAGAAAISPRSSQEVATACTPQRRSRPAPGYARGHVRLRSRRDRLRPRRRKGRRAGGLLRQARRRRRALARARRRLRQHRHPAVEDAARDRASSSPAIASARCTASRSSSPARRRCRELMCRQEPVLGHEGQRIRANLDAPRRRPPRRRGPLRRRAHARAHARRRLAAPRDRRTSCSSPPARRRTGPRSCPSKIPRSTTPTRSCASTASRSAMVILGGGVIGCEYASIFAALGTRCTIVEGRDQILGFLDGEVNALLTKQLRTLGCELLFKREVVDVGRSDGMLHCRLSDGTDLECERLLVRRRPRRQHARARARAHRRRTPTRAACSRSTRSSASPASPAGASTPPVTSSASPRWPRSPWSRGASPPVTPSASSTSRRSPRSSPTASTPSPRCR